jgi:hypothetical protein
MSQFQAVSKSEAFVVSALAMPFMAIQTAGRLIGRSLSRSPAIEPAPQAPAPVAVKPEPQAAPSRNQLVAADRVCSADIDGQRVNFRQYFGAKVIYVSCRANRRLQEATFTPAIADECGIAYDLDGAIQWMRERGFEGNRARSRQPGPQPQGRVEQMGEIDLIAPPFDAPFKSRPMARPGMTKARGSVAAESAEAQPFTHTLVPADERHGRPFRGRVVSFGEEERPGRGQEKPYVTYVLKMESESGQYKKDFIGEHLGELVEKYDLRRGQLVTVQLVGKEHFQVEVNGKMEPRKRNHYSIKIH